MRIALVDDDHHLAELVKIWLEEAGHETAYFSSGVEFTRMLRRESYDLVLLDWIMPEMDGEGVLRWMQEQSINDLPVIFLTQKTGEDDIAKVLDLGADDYITKPVRQKELLARINAVARRASPNSVREVLEIPPFKIDINSHSLYCNDELVKMTQKEFELVVFLFKNIGRLLSRGHILSSVWGHGDEFNTRTVDTHISRIRKKLELTPENGWRLSAIYHQGYRLEQVESEELRAGNL
ncbi:MAG: response regulator transcription factor [Gammaproteobacteria bacterium]|nr:response regulator transcription factor [Gammaproteobacteria bacterium]MDH5777789.1 response regulator transcription factor [Gammaproteobacteria bacterium]